MPTKIKCTFLEDDKGNKSSKRLSGIVLCLIGIIFAIITFYKSLDQSVGDSQTILSIIQLFLFFGSSLLGLGSIAEKWISRK